ncbi:iron-containing alcohol dehydrogenase family protein [Halopiger djelfimassiliensis]|uniref:iron-containing alcohol dehydrogenase family protein n=1 Tax=Halopiger djelfimassiliensis TaxID=1293047 RepID=UPI000677FAAB|nr:iron-containing alcohol dehydrogenase family protein [Halopiger djelfimassiliensis]
MTPPSSNGRGSAFRFEYEPPTIRVGVGCVAALGAELERRGLERALVVCGSTVGDTPAVIDPVTVGLGDRLAGVFDETTPAKRLATAFDGLERLRAENADVLVSLGGGSSLDVAKVISALSASDRSPAGIASAFAETGTITVPDEGLVPIVAIPTTLAGADLSQVAGVTVAPESGLVEEAHNGGVADPRLMPAAACYDPELVATTPESVLAGSAMNGFDKGLETIYASNATPITDATATRGLRTLVDGLAAFGDGKRDTGTFETLLEGIVLVQYGISRPGETTLSIIHAFGHGLTRGYDLQQGTAHAVVAPHVLEYLFEREGVDARPAVLAAALGVAETPGDPADPVVDAVREVRDTLGLPARLRDVSGPDPEAFDAVANAILEDRFMANAPPGLAPSATEIEDVLERAW